MIQQGQAYPFGDVAAAMKQHTLVDKSDTELAAQRWAQAKDALQRALQNQAAANEQAQVAAEVEAQAWKELEAYAGRLPNNKAVSPANCGAFPAASPIR